jgi:hypothetical protein
MGIQNHAVSEVFLGFLALGFGLLLHGVASPPLSCSWGRKFCNHPLTLLPLPGTDRVHVLIEDNVH